MTLESTVNGGALRIVLPEKLDSSNSEEVKTAILEIRANSQEGTLILDASKTRYVSSAGLRVFLYLKKKEDDLLVDQISNEVYEVFEITGFDKVLSYTRVLRKMTVDNLETIGRGASAIVYRIDPDTIVKVFSKDMQLNAIKLELDKAKKAFLSGIETAISYDIVKVGDQYGCIYEMINASTLSEIVFSDPEKEAEYVPIYAEFMKKMHGIELDPADFSGVREKYNKYLALLSTKLDENTCEIIKKLLEAVPESNTFVHGDFHPKNVMFQENKPILIDMGEVSYGHPVFDIMSFGVLAVMSSILTDEVAVPLAGMTCEQIRRVWMQFLTGYFEVKDSAELEKINSICLSYSVIRCLAIVALLPSQFPQELLLLLSKKVVDAYNNGITGLGDIFD